MMSQFKRALRTQVCKYRTAKLTMEFLANTSCFLLNARFPPYCFTVLLDSRMYNMIYKTPFLVIGKKPNKQRIVNNMSEMMSSGVPDVSSGFAIFTNVNVPLRHRKTMEINKYEVVNPKWFFFNIKC